MSIAITCGSPPNGKVGTAYTHTFPVTGATPPNTFTVSAGSLPSGLTLVSATGVLSGVPSAAGTYAFTVLVTDTVGSSSVACTILIKLNVSCNNPPSGSIGTPYTHTLTTTGGTAPYIYTLTTSGTLPPGLTLDGGSLTTYSVGEHLLGPVTPRPVPLTGTPTPVVNGWATTLDSGSDQPHAMVYAGDSLWIGCESNPGRICRINPLNPAVITTIILPNDGRHGPVLDMCYIPSKGKLYALCTDFFDPAIISSVVEVDPVTGAYTDVITATYGAGQGAIAFDSNYLYVVSWFTKTVYRYSLTGFGLVSSLLLNLLQLPHAMEYDPVSGFLFVTSAANSGDPMIAQINVGTFTVVNYGYLPTDRTMSDDIAFAGGYVWAGSEASGNVVKFLATNVTAPPVIINTGITGRNFGVYYDGGVIWTGWEGNAAIFGRISVTTNAVELFYLPNRPAQSSPNEFVRRGTNLYITGWTSPGQVSQITVTDYDPVVVPAGIITGTPTTGGSYIFSVHVVDSAGNSGDASCSITIATGIGCNNPPAGAIGVPYTHSITVAPAGSIASITGGTLPPGLSMSAGGVITGTPSLAGNYTFTITVTAV
jgi:hypothetical protein